LRVASASAFLRRPALAVAALVLLSTLVRWLAARHVQGPWISPDETVYALLGQSLYRHASLAILGGPTPFYSLVVPLLVGPFLSLGDLELGYALLKPVLALVMSLAAVPVYLWARSVTSRGWALAAAALVLVVPGLAYSGLVMSEVVFFPVVTLAAWAAARALAVPTPRSAALLALALTLALLTRLQALVLLPVVFGAAILDAGFTRSPGRLRAQWPVLAAACTPVLAWFLFQQLRGEPSFGAYESATGARLATGDAARFVLYHAAALVLTTGVVPVCALLALALTAARGREADPLRRATIAVTLALAVGVVVQVGVFASEHVGQVAERDMLCVVPSLAVCFGLWLGGADAIGVRSRLVVGGLALAALAAFPFGKLLTYHALFDAITLAPFWHLQRATSSATVTTVVLIAGAVVVALFVFLPLRLRAVLAGTLFVVALLGSVSSAREVTDEAKRTRAVLVGNHPRWIDSAAHGRSVTYVYDGNRDWPAVWQALFWNRSIDHVAVLGGTPVPGPVPQEPLDLRGDGRIAVRDPDVVLAASFGLAGTPLAQIAQLVPGQEGLQVWQLAPPPRILSRALGLKTNGDIYGNEPARIVAYDCGHGTWQLTLIPKSKQTVALVQDGKLLRRVQFTDAEVASNYYVNLDLPVAPHAGETCTLEVRPTGLVGTTRFGFLHA
jgi:Dolichyl-phosphate-mannose-protein mannosyltransferase